MKLLALVTDAPEVRRYLAHVGASTDVPAPLAQPRTAVLEEHGASHEGARRRRAYDIWRKAVTFVRWHERDADAILPSLFALRSVPRAA